MTSERRRDPRVKWEAPAAFKPSLHKQSYQGQTVDLSKGGSLIQSPIPLEAGSGLELRIDLGEFRLVPIDGKVCRSNPTALGHDHLIAIEFDERHDALMDVVVQAADEMF